MIDTFHISDGSVNRQVFYATGPNTFQTWNKPQNCKFVYFVLIGGGGGGGGGQSGGTGTSRRGGGSGGSGGLTKGMFPSSIIPNTLYIQVVHAVTKWIILVYVITKHDVWFACFYA